MSKSTFYFSIAVLVAVDIIRSSHQRKLKAMHRDIRVFTFRSRGRRNRRCYLRIRVDSTGAI